MEQVQKMLLELLISFKQKELEDLTGVGQSSISKIKNGKFKFVNVEKADAIRNFYYGWKKETSVVQN